MLLEAPLAVLISEEHVKHCGAHHARPARP